MEANCNDAIAGCFKGLTLLVDPEVESDLELLSTALRENDFLEMHKLVGVGTLSVLQKTFEKAKIRALDP